MIKRIPWQLIVLVLISISFLSCKSSSHVSEQGLTQNSKASIKKPYVILISLDGFRWDYVDKYKPPHLTNFIENGIQSEYLTPSFPSKTFPNHYSIATGMYPDKHGIIGNTFYSYKKERTYENRNREMVEDGSFYGGSPIWAQADKSQMVSASYFFVGSESKIQDIRPTYYYRYDGAVKNEARIAQAMTWLSLPEKERPHLITLYFSDMDDVGHRYGPSNEVKIKQALFKLDQNLGDLFKGVKSTALPVNIIIVSDHGMSDLSTKNFLEIETIKNDSLYSTIDNGSLVSLHPKKGSNIDAIIRNLKKKEHHFKVYKTADTPGFEYVPKNKDWGAIQVQPDYGYYFSTKGKIETMKTAAIHSVGVHGYGPEHKDMAGIFYAKGPAFKKGFSLGAIRNIEIYPLICEILNLEIPRDIDGSLEMIKSVLKTE
ncbi:ectonucleotide pyrophosphatase/phosphodiesterase [Gelidibacter mesophilus]|uniref:alkaline phosphatase family protein n=1 Tax=Gelidibacter mesophilus TaxID=169050 RepID=UPI0003FEC0C3|nr:ectonucleotide pyrophosphatase/phosphodiesterase [Gelidibacter mesophilus]